MTETVVEKVFYWDLGIPVLRALQANSANVGDMAVLGALRANSANVGNLTSNSIVIPGINSLNLTTDPTIISRTDTQYTPFLTLDTGGANWRVTQYGQLTHYFSTQNPYQDRAYFSLGDADTTNRAGNVLVLAQAAYDYMAANDGDTAVIGFGSGALRIAQRPISGATVSAITVSAGTPAVTMTNVAITSLATSYASDSAAAAGNVPLYGLYNNAGQVQVRLA